MIADEADHISSEIEMIEQALDAVLEKAIEHDLARPARGGSGRVSPTPFDVADLANIPTRAQSDVMALIDDPIRASLRQALRRLGERLYELTRDTDRMCEVLERVADRDPQHYGRRAGILDRTWHGIGTWMS